MKKVKEAEAKKSSSETTLCEQVAHGFFRLGRINGLEENYFALQCDWKERNIRCEDPQISNAMLQALNFFANPEKFALLTLYEQRIHRKTHKDLKLLMDLQAKPAKQNPLLVRQEPTEAPEPEAEQALTATASASESTTSPENGFVFSSAPKAANPTAAAPEMEPKTTVEEAEIPKAA